tara:strand:+ start:915 stop:1520 length:606 start_codon:yes stop_codon:yes gene_type:complete
VRNNSPLILASESKSRATILEHAGVDFCCVPSFCDEKKIKLTLKRTNTPTKTIARKLAEAKANLVSKKHPDLYVLAADQILECNGAAYDKPKNLEQARQHLLDLRGKSHFLYTATVIYKSSKCVWQNHEKLEMQMRHYSNDFIDEYLRTLGPSVCESVGAYKLEGLGVQFFEKVNGDYFSILGLPLLPLLNYLRQIGLLKE